MQAHYSAGTFASKKAATSRRRSLGEAAHVAAAHVAAAPPDIERLVHFTYFKPGKVRRLVSVDIFFNQWLGVSIDATDSDVDHELESKLGIRYEIPSRHRRGTYPIRAFVAQHLRNVLGHRYCPETLPDLETSITYPDIEDVVVLTPPFSRPPHQTKRPVHPVKTVSSVMSPTAPASQEVLP